VERRELEAPSEKAEEIQMLIVLAVAASVVGMGRWEDLEVACIQFSFVAAVLVLRVVRRTCCPAFV
jgi:hypothetical protein